MSNVIDLWAKKEEKQQQKFDEIVEDFTSYETDVIETATITTIEIVEMLGEQGIDVESNTESVKELMVLVDVIKSLIHRVHGMPYPLHDYADAIFDKKGNVDYDALMHKFLYGEEENS